MRVDESWPSNASKGCNSHQLSLTLANSHQLSPTHINSHQLSSTLINSPQLSSTLINSHQLSSSFDQALSYVDYVNSHKHKLISKLRSCIIVMRAFFGKALVSYLLKISVDERNVKNGIRAILLNLPNPIPKITGLNSIFPLISLHHNTHYITEDPSHISYQQFMGHNNHDYNLRHRNGVCK